MSTEVGRAHVTIFANTSPYRREVATLGRYTLRQRVHIPVRVDTRAADATVRRLRSDLRGLGSTTRIRINSSGVGGAQSQVERLAATLRGIRGATVRVNARTEEGMRNLRQLEREATNLARRAYRLSFTAQTSQARGELRRLQAAAQEAARDATLRIDAETGRARAELSALDAFLSGMRDRKIRVDVDTRPAVAAGAALRGALDQGNAAINRFNRAAMTLRNVMGTAVRFAILGVIAALGPLVGMATVAGAGLAALAAGGGLVASALASSLVPIANHKTASEALETANQGAADSADALADAEENLARVEEEGARSVEQMARAREEAAESLRRAEIRANERIAEATARVAEQRRALEEAEGDRAENIEDRLASYRRALQDLDRIAEENAERLADAREAARETEEDYFRTLEKNAERLAEARARVAEQERAYAELIEENARREKEAREGIAEAEESVAEVIEDQNARVADSRERAAEAAEATLEAEEDLAEERRGLRGATDDLNAAQAEYNRLLRPEPRRREEGDLAFDEARFRVDELRAEIASLELERQDALAAGDTARAEEIRREIEGRNLDLRGANIRLDEAREEYERIKRGGVSEELQQARDEIEAAWEARREQQERVQEAAERVRELELAESEALAGIEEARRERDEAVAEAIERVNDLREDYFQLLRDNDRAEAEARNRILELRGEVADIQEENAEREEEALSRMRDARDEIVRVEEENRRRLLEGQQRASEQYEALIDARVEGAEAVEAAERGLKDAIEDRARTARDLRWEIRDQREALNRSAEDYRNAQVQAERGVEDAVEAVTDAQEDLRRKQDEVAEAAEETGASLTASQAALYAALIGFRDSYLAAFRPAQDSLNGLVIRVLDLAERALPYLGRVTLGIAEELHGVFDELTVELLSPEQQELFHRFFDALPGIVGDAVSAASRFLLGLFDVFAVATPYVEEFFAWLDEKGQRFLDWAQSPEGQASLKRFFEEAEYFAGLFAEVLADVAVFLYEIGTSAGFKMILENVARFLDLLARNPEGIQAALWVIGAFGQAVARLLDLVPGLAPATVIMGTFLGTLALFGAGHFLASLAFMWGFRRVLGSFLSWATGRSIRIPSMLGLIARGIRALGGSAGGALGPLRVFAFRLLDFLDNLTRVWPGRALRALGRLPSLAGRALSGLGRAVWRALSGIPRLFAQALGGLGRLVWGLLSPVGRIAWRALSGLGRLAWRALVGVPRLFSRALSGLPGYVGRLFLSLVRGAGRVLGGLGRVVWSALSGLGRVFSRGLGWMPGYAGRVFWSVVRSAGRVLGSLPSVVGRALSAVAGAFSRVLGGFLPRLFGSFVRGALGGILVRGAAAVLAGPLGWVVGIGSLLIAPFTRFATWWNLELIPRYVAMFRALFGPRRVLMAEVENFRRTLENMPIFGGIFTQARRLGDWLGGWMRALGGWLEGGFRWIGETMVWGWISGLVSRARDLLNYLVELARSAWETVTNFNQSFSPSRLWEKEGANNVEGLIRAYRNGASRVAAAARNVARAASAGFSEGDFSREVALRTTVRRPVPAPARGFEPYEFAEQIVRRAMPAGGREAYRGPRQIVIPVSVGGKRLEEVVVDVNARTAREARRSGAATGRW